MSSPLENKKLIYSPEGSFLCKPCGTQTVSSPNWDWTVTLYKKETSNISDEQTEEMFQYIYFFLRAKELYQRECQKRDEHEKIGFPFDSRRLEREKDIFEGTGMQVNNYAKTCGVFWKLVESRERTYT